MTFTFTPPSRTEVPSVLPEENIGNRLMRFFRARPAGVNVYLYRAGSLSAAAHGRVDETDPVALYDTNGVATTNGWDDLEVVFWGGHVAVTINADQASALIAAGYTVTTAAQAPTITSITPDTASSTDNTVLTITGSGFAGATDLAVGGVSLGAPGTEAWVIVNDTEILMVATPHADGVVDVVVTTPLGVAHTSFTYSTPVVNAPPAITAVSPTSGIAGTSVTITGTHFAAATSVTFDGVTASYVINSATSITATAPTHGDATISVSVADANGASNGFSWTYATPPAPVITSVSPASGVAATAITLTGTTFSGATSVTVGGASVAYTVVSSTSITLTAPTHVDGAVTITVTTPYGSGSNTFTYSTPAPQNPPALTSLSVSSGPTTGGTSVTINGTSMDLTTGVSFGGTAVTFNVLSAVAVSCTSPAHVAGQVSVVCNSNNGPSNGLTFTYADSDPHPGSDLLLEDGSFLLQEDNTSTIQLES